MLCSVEVVRKLQFSNCYHVSRSCVVNTYRVSQVGIVNSPLWRLYDIEETGG